jgi:c-di-GMP-binding flagellar brake protein YcgR
VSNSSLLEQGLHIKSAFGHFGLAIIKVPPVEFDAERRRFIRVMVSLEVEYCADFPETGELLHGQGTLKDFSLSGVYFFSDPPIPLLPGQTLTLIISTSLPNLDLFDTSHIKARGEVVRLEPTEPSRRQFGIAINFLESPTFFNPTKMMTDSPY